MELVETLFSKSAREQMKQSRNGYKLSKFVQKIFADLFVDTGAIHRLITLLLTTVHKASTRGLAR